jgi:hypothetical protein
VSVLTLLTLPALAAPARDRDAVLGDPLEEHAPSAAWLVSFVLLRGVFAVIAAAATLRSFTPRWEGRT